MTGTRDFNDASTKERTRAPSRRGLAPRAVSQTFGTPIGSRIDPDGIDGYYIDFSIKPQKPSWPPDFVAPKQFRLWVGITQWALGCYERFLAEEGERWLIAGLEAAEHLLAHQHSGGRLDGAWFHHRPLAHTFELTPPWVSGMAQGEAASLLVRLHQTTGRDEFADAARRALRPLAVPTSEGGATVLLGGKRFPEEYPTDPPSYVLNGGIFGLWGLRDVGVALNDDDARLAFEEGLEALVGGLPRWDLGSWSSYDLFPHPVANVASAAYHELHIDQLRAMAAIAPRSELDATATRFEQYASSRRARARALAGKVLFRVVVPRNPALAHRLPWSNRGGK